MIVKILKRGRGYDVQFNFGVQTFTLAGEGKYTKAEANWYAKMLRLCFSDFKKSLLTNTKEE